MVSVYRKDESLKRCRKPHPSFVKNHGMLQQLPFFFFLWVIMVLSNFSWFFCANLYKEKKERQDIGKDLGSEFTINLSLGCEILRYKWTIIWVWVFSFGSFFFLLDLLWKAVLFWQMNFLPAYGGIDILCGTSTKTSALLRSFRLKFDHFLIQIQLHRILTNVFSILSNPTINVYKYNQYK